MWTTPVVLGICLGLVTSAPTIADQLGTEDPAEDASLGENSFGDFDSAFDLNDTSASEGDYGSLEDIFSSLLEDYDATQNSTQSLGEEPPQNNNALEEILSATDITSPEDIQPSEGNASSGATLTPETAATSEEATTSKAPTTTTQTPASEDNASQTEPASPGADSPSSSSSSSSSPSAAASEAPPPASETDQYDYYDYSDTYGDYTPPTAFPFSIFKDTEPRPPTSGDIMPSACAWAVVQCCNNPDKMGSRVMCFSHVGCYGAWMQDFCTPELQKVVFKSVFKSFQFSL